ARSYEPAVFDVARLLEDGHGAGEVGAVVQQPPGRLGQGLEHHDAREDREGGEVVGEVFLGQTDVLHRNDPVVGERFDPVDQVEFHADNPTATRANAA